MGKKLAESLKTLLNETFEGPGNGGSYYTDSRPNTGIFGTLEGLNAEDASLSIHGSTIAAHSDHIRYYLWVVRSLISGVDFEKDWEASWTISKVDEAKWAEIKEGLQREYFTLLSEIETINLEEWLTNVNAIVAHSAYHLGALRQMIKTLESEK
ncbi:hypothetical protein GW626_10695 [Peribacillus muralis]|uniref:hypothetical protein n=1 Tax=Peribacillus muralis TaxID=264697 RepID=UPI001F4DA03B|nr:hypothetical protein [Peribacillus muralis]MCK1993475.1 hypothetical protein [Peribacillus muralis]MCK2014237.1 hypothetical protein [Peribacillus muralis]